MKFYVDLYEPRIQFIVVSNDMKWCQEQFPLIESQLIGNSSKTDNQRNSLLINVTYSIGHSAGEELALLASCDHVLMSTGTYGWWAAWLAKGTTVYYADWPRNGSSLANSF
jgi:galactoside 2-L-fucosyltransferase 1/2